jgi:hypothetical protein
MGPASPTIRPARPERRYARAGFACAEEKRDPAFEALTGAPGFHRFARAI